MWTLGVLTKNQGLPDDTSVSRMMLEISLLKFKQFERKKKDSLVSINI